MKILIKYFPFAQVKKKGKATYEVFYLLSYKIFLYFIKQERVNIKHAMKGREFFLYRNVCFPSIKHSC